MADNKYKILLRRGKESDLNTAFYDIGEPIFLSDSGKLLIKKNDGTMAEFVVSDDAKENTSNKVQEINFPSSDYYPSTKAVFDYVNSKLETPLSDIESLKSGKLDKTDFNTYKTATDKAVGDKADNIVCSTDKASSCYLNDSSRNHIKVLSLYGNSIQSSVPTPTAPVNIDNVNNPTITLYKKNLFDFSVCNVNVNDSATINSTDRDNCTISFVTNETGVSSGVYLRHIDLSVFNKGYGVDYTKLGGKPVALSFDIQSDINCRIGVQFTKYSYKYFDITPEKQRIVVTDTVDINKLSKALCFYTNKTKANITISNIQIEVNNTATDYEDCDCQKVTLADADINSLHTYYPNTTVISDSDFILTYIADPKNYIDSKVS